MKYKLRETPSFKKEIGKRLSQYEFNDELLDEEIKITVEGLCKYAYQIGLVNGADSILNEIEEGIKKL